MSMDLHRTSLSLPWLANQESYSGTLGPTATFLSALPFR